MTHLWRRVSRIAVSLVLALWPVVILGGCAPGAAGSAGPSQAATSPTSPTSATSTTPATSPTLAQPLRSDDPSPISIGAPRLPDTDPTSGLPFIDFHDLPREALDTLAFIDRDGPFPFDRDGISFQNREELLPDEPDGYYREYTVITPGLSHRGARRIVAGEGGERYYTADHYESFERIRLSDTDP